MRRFVFTVTICLIGAVPSVRAQLGGGHQDPPPDPGPAARSLSPAELAQTGEFVSGFQNKDGGFASIAGGASTLGSTSSAIRSLKYVGGSIRNVPACIAFVKKCRDGESGGFAQTPGGRSDVATTAVGLMALAELRVADDAATQAAIAYFSKNVKTFEEIRIAVAGLEAVKAKSPDFPAWIKQVESDRKADGTWGEGTAKARATGSAAVALLRMGVELDKNDAIVAALREGQRPDGGWSDGDKPTDLGSSYRIMRCFSMLKEKPDIDRLLAYLAAHRQADGGYAPSAGKPADLGSTYSATIMMRWARLLNGEPALVETAGFQPLFNGVDLQGWGGSTHYWSARDGMIVGDTTAAGGTSKNEFLATDSSYGDFVLKLSFRLLGDEKSNSGVQFRSVRIAASEMSGYQADIGQGYWGCLYDESRRNKILAQASEKALANVHKGDWNHYVLRVMGDHITLTLNGQQSVDYHEPDPNIARDGRIALQIHAGGPMIVQFKDIYIQPLPRPTADPGSTPGFHLRAVKTPAGERKYTVFLPTRRGARMPVVLFLHGSGERGSDGVLSAQVGLGAVIAGRPQDFPFIGVFPQAEKTWAADSEDAAAALAALDDVLATFPCDRRVILTGLSMGGFGSWELAAAHPERFAAVVPVCGFARPERAKAIKDLPVWTIVGDDDGERIVKSTRELADVLAGAKVAPRSTEYRGVGHNSWDRAYSDRQLIRWMMKQVQARAFQ